MTTRQERIEKAEQIIRHAVDAACNGGKRTAAGNLVSAEIRDIMAKAAEILIQAHQAGMAEMKADEPQRDGEASGICIGCSEHTCNGSFANFGIHWEQLPGTYILCPTCREIRASRMHLPNHKTPKG